MHNIGNHNISNMVLYCLLDEINGPTASLENARDFLFQKNLLKNSMSCPGCNAAMSLVPCSSSKSPDGLIWRCSPCKKYRNIRIDSALSGQKIALKTFIQLLFCLSIKGLTGIAVSQMTGLSENTVSDWKIYLHTRLIEIDYPTSNIVPIYLQQLLLKNFLTYSKWFTYQRRPNG